jgi:hypothetical protein
MKTYRLFATLAIASAVLWAGCSKDGISPLKPNSTSLSGKSTLSLKAMSLVSVPLGSAANFAVLAGTTVTNAGPSLLTSNLGVSPGSAITGFQPVPINTIMGPGTVTPGLGVVNGVIYAGGPVAALAHNDAVLAYNFLVAQVPDTIYAGVSQLDGRTFTPGIYQFAPSANLQVNGTVYLDFQGNSNAQFIFQMGTTLVTMAGSRVIALNNNNTTCLASNVFWAVGSSATINGTQFIGTVVANTTITMTSGSNVAGRMLAINGAVTMLTDTISACSGSSTDTIPAVTPCRDFVTGGGWISVKKGEKATFGVSGGIKNNKFWGQLSFNDHAKKGMNVKSTSVTDYIVIDAFTRQIEGVARVNDHNMVTYKVVVTDNGEPGRNDKFSLELSNGYFISGTLDGGNIQLHLKCGEKKDHNDKESYDDHNERDGNNGCNNDNNDNQNKSGKDHNYDKE